MRLSSIFSDGMILQRGKPALLKGHARGNQVTVTFAGNIYKTEPLQGDYFEISLPSFDAGGPYEMVIYDGERTVISDIMIGDVYLLGGQSNMELPVSRTMDVSEAYIAGDDYPDIRMFQVPKEYCFEGPCEVLSDGSWRKATAKNIMDFSAAGYFLAKNLYEAYQIPIGLIHAAVGGTPVEAWMSEEALLELGLCEERLRKNKDKEWVDSVIASDNERISGWHNTLRSKDKGIAEHWERQENAAFSNTFLIPGMWENTELDSYKGSIWFAKEFEVPEEWEGKEVLLRLGAIIDGDTTYVNGVMVGYTDYRYPPRKYLLPPDLLHSGKNVVTIHMFSDAQPGGFMPGKKYGLEYRGKFISLEGEWKYKIGVPMERLEPQTFFQYEPAGLFNKMIAPLKGFGIAGAAYYQGESNKREPKGYSEKFEKMIAVWREQLGQGEVPFLYVQLPYFAEGREGWIDEDWEALRREQKKALRIPNTAMIDAYDIGEYNDLHPQNKMELGRRLFMAARKLIYKEDILY
ncbi:sialate O-acetylesterase [Konateibacter massiliensis]|uniref:sialate O-acetylesterase n=1 Tax=Konateibacter massiliensis TaxID=2002841 RepID=UPI000C161E6A|nr:sialate O-acetylesterase [Konateibacter massiliensis]